MKLFVEPKEQRTPRNKFILPLEEVQNVFRMGLEDKSLFFSDNPLFEANPTLMIKRKYSPVTIKLELKKFKNKCLILGNCYRQFSNDERELWHFYHFSIQDNEQLVRELKVLNFLLRTF